MGSPIAVLGAGAWGTALAMQLARNGNPVRLWSHDPLEVAALKRDGSNQHYLPDIALPKGIELHTELDQALEAASFCLLVIPSHGFSGLLQRLSGLNLNIPLFWATKGLEISSGRLLHEVVQEFFPGLACGVISGPTFAKEVALDLPAAITCAGTDPQATERFAHTLHGGHFRCYSSSDVVGVEVGGALKNILAIAVGAADGLGYGANTRAALITRGMAEMMRFSQFKGGQAETLMGLAGLGDLVLTCTDNQSRNRQFGLAIGQGLSKSEALDKVGHTVEGAKAAQAVYPLVQRYDIDMPICTQVYEVLELGKSPQQAVADLEQRARKSESLSGE